MCVKEKSEKKISRRWEEEMKKSESLLKKDAIKFEES